MVVALKVSVSGYCKNDKAESELLKSHLHVMQCLIPSHENASFFTARRKEHLLACIL
jgi:hypothetical protein